MSKALIKHNMETQVAGVPAPIQQQQVALPVVTTEQFIEQQLATMPEAEAAIAELKAKADALVINGLDDIEGFKKVDEARKEAKRRRGAVKNHQDKLLEVPKAFTAAVKSRAGKLIGLLEEIETSLEAKQQPIKDEQARIKREQEEAERKRIEAERLLNERTQTRTRQLFNAKFTYNGEQYAFGINGEEFVITDEEIKALSDEDYQAKREEFKAWKTERLPAPEPVAQPAPQPVAPQPVATPAPQPAPQAEQHFNVSTAYPSNGVPAPQPLPAARPSSGYSSRPAPSGLGLPVRNEQPSEYSPAYIQGFSAAKALIIAKLHEPATPSKLELIEFIKALPVQDVQ